VELDGATQSRLAGRLVELPLYAPAVVRDPAPGAEGLAHVHAQAEAAGRLHHVLALAADLHDGGAAAPQQLAHRELDAGPAPFLVLGGAAHGQHLEEPGEPELWVPAVLDERLVERRAGDVGVGRDEPGREDAVARVHRLVGGPFEARAHVNDPVPFEHHDAVTQEAMPSTVEADDVARTDERAPRAHQDTHASIALYTP
jgi:hypothetical protein